MEVRDRLYPDRHNGEVKLEEVRAGGRWRGRGSLDKVASAQQRTKASQPRLMRIPRTRP
jgi:hypothetical protein